jgi:acyl-CoA synthetase (AMP-forming)/AMP-acid ligase II
MTLSYECGTRRIRDIVIRGGENIYPWEIEELGLQQAAETVTA